MSTFTDSDGNSAEVLAGESYLIISMQGVGEVKVLDILSDLVAVEVPDLGLVGEIDLDTFTRSIIGRI